jgi:hypothetical protein
MKICFVLLALVITLQLGSASAEPSPDQWREYYDTGLDAMGPLNNCTDSVLRAENAYQAWYDCETDCCPDYDAIVGNACSIEVWYATRGLLGTTALSLSNGTMLTYQQTAFARALFGIFCSSNPCDYTWDTLPLPQQWGLFAIGFVGAYQSPATIEDSCPYLVSSVPAPASS